MSHAHVSHTKRIWTVFGLLSLITTVEVGFGIVRPDALFLNTFIGVSLLNWLFIILTLVKAYYIVWAFMHMEGEKKTLKNAVVFPLIFLVCYLLFILLTEGDYVFEVFKSSTIKWNF
jgi:cytochrome c oxidase subunit 4